MEKEEISKEHSKEHGETEKGFESEKVDNSELDESLNEEEEQEQNGLDIDEQLEETAAKKNLSVLNVKSIIHHVLKDKRVIAMAKKQAEEEVSSDCDEDFVYEPKLTRYRVRQAVATSVAKGALTPEKLSSIARRPILLSPLGTTPTKQASSCLLESTFSEESSDDEYDPNHEITKDSEGFTSEFDDEDRVIEEEETEVESDEDVSTDDDDVDDRYKTPSQVTSPQAPLSSTQQQEEPVDKAGTSEQSVSVTRPDHITAYLGTSTETSIHTQPLCTSDTVSVSEPVPVTSVKPVSIEQAGNSDLIDVNSSCDQTVQDCFSQKSGINLTSGHSHQPAAQMSSGFSAEYEERVMQEAASLLASLSDTLLSPPRPIVESCQVETQFQSSSSNAETDFGDIARRTRSKFPLTDTDITAIEASFQPPDLPSEDISMSGVELELDEDDRQWQQWLSDLMKPSASSQPEEVEDQDDDTEYNFWADRHEDEKEEFRNDRGVRIPQREVDDLIEELLNPNNGVFTDTTTLTLTPTHVAGDVTNLTLPSGLDLTSAYLLDSLGLHPPVLTQSLGSCTNTPLANEKDVGHATTESIAVPSNEVVSMATSDEGSGCLSRAQTLQLWEQIQQHFQLLVQTFVLTRFEPSLVFLSQIAVQAIEEMLQWSAETEQGRNSSVWYIPGKEEASQLIEKLNPHCSDAVELVSATGSPPKIPDPVQDILMNNGIFWQYPQLLPEIGFAPLENARNSSHKYFTTEEDHLLVMGMDHYGSSSWKLIQENLLPTKTPHQLHLRVKNLCSRRTKGDNVVKYYKRTNEVKVPFRTQDASKEGQSVDGTISISLPSWVMNYHKKREEKEKAEERKKGKHIDNLNRIASLYKNVTTAGHQTSPTISTTSDNSGSTGSKRNLSEQLTAAETNTKKVRLSSDEDVEPSKSKALVKKPFNHGRRGGSRKGGRRQKKAPLTPPVAVGKSKWQEPMYTSSSQADMTQLLFMAGLEASDPAARYAYNYLTEVKVSLLDCPGQYDKFLQVLTDARKQSWKPSKVYQKISILLSPWPHLMRLFTEFLKPGDTPDAKSLEEKMDLQHVKNFVSKLERKYESSPLQLEQAFSVMAQLSMEHPSSQFTKKVIDSLSPLLEVHKDLLDDVKCFLDGSTKPHLSCDEQYEQIVLGSGDEGEPDCFEEWRITDDFPFASRLDKSKATEPKTVEQRNSTLHGGSAHKPVEIGTASTRQMTSKSLGSSAAGSGTAFIRKENREMERDNKQERNAMASHAGTSVGLSPLTQPSKPAHSTVASTGCGGVSFGVDIVSTTGHSKESGCGRVALGTIEGDEIEGRTDPRQWTRVEDRAILQDCQGQAISHALFASVAARIDRTPLEVESRFKQLLSLLHSLDS